MRYFLLLLLFSSSAFANDAFPTTRRSGLPSSDWSTAGVLSGAGRPSVTTINTTLTSSDTAATINAAIAACPSNQVIKLGAGLYNMAGSEIDIAKDGVVLRGSTNSAGFPTTILSNCVFKIAKSQWPSAGSWANITGQNVSSGLTEGSTSITLSAAASSEFAVGNLFCIDQLFDGTSVKDSTAEFAHRPDRSYSQMVQCTSKSGSTLGFRPALVGTYWNVTQDPEAWGWTATYGDTMQMSGVEDVDIPKAGSGTQVITMGPCYNCWIRNMRGTDWPDSGGGSFVRIAYSSQCEITWCIIHDGALVMSSSYAIYPTMVSFSAFEFNIFTNLPLAMPCITAVGCSFSYNYATGPYPYSPSAWLPEYFFPHGGHTHHTLYEGNWVEGPIYLDAITGGNNNSDIGIVHNRVVGWFTGKTSDTTPIQMEADMDNITVLANVLGMEGYHTTYASCYAIDASCSGIIRTNNYDTGTDGVASSETLSGSDSVATSYRHASVPADFGGLAWPSFPLTSVSTNQGYYTNQPAGYRNWAGQFPPAASSDSTPNIVSRKLDGRIRLKR